MNDLRYTFRMLRKTPLFTAAVVLTVALGIGATTAIFTVVNAVMLRPLPYADPDRLVWVAERNDRLNLATFSASVLNYLSWKEQAHSFDALGAVGFASFNLTGQGEPEQLTGGTLTPSIFPLLGVAPVAGRSFVDGEDRPGAEPVAMISESLWRRRFGADPALVGGHVTLNGTNRTVVGIVPSAVALLSPGDVWVPLSVDPARQNRLNHVILAVGRMKPNVTLEQAQSDMDAVSRAMASQYPEIKDWGIRLVTFYRLFVGHAAADVAARAPRRRRVRAAHRVRERRESAAQPRDRARAGDGRARPRSARAAAACCSNCSSRASCSRRSAASSGSWSRPGPCD